MLWVAVWPLSRLLRECASSSDGRADGPPFPRPRVPTPARGKNKHNDNPRAASVGGVSRRVGARHLRFNFEPSRGPRTGAP
eukprot:5038929-Pyramimonas_sp.AAC.1